MAKRVKISDKVETKVLTRSRRRCCVCWGLNQDDKIKKGQISHLDGNPSNNISDNLAYLCFDHHDEYDSKNSQSKGLKKSEVKKYRDELYQKYEFWGYESNQYHFLNFLAFTIDNDQLADAAIKAAGTIVWWTDILAHNVLTFSEVEYTDGDLYIPHLHVLDYYASWGWLTFECEGLDERNSSVKIKVNHKPMCKEIAKLIKKRIDVKHDESSKSK